MSFEVYRTKFKPLYDAVKTAHTEAPQANAGHGLDHDVAVAMMCVKLAGNNQELADNGFIAGMIHSTDRFFEEKEDAQLDKYLHLVQLPASEKNEIKEAVQRHTEFKDRNLETRKPTQRLLMDADKLVNLNLLVTIRSGQFRPNLDAIDLEYIGKRNPLSTHKNPISCIGNLHAVLEWVQPGWFHLPEAQFRAEVLAEDIVDYIRRSERMFVELGLAGIKL